MQVHSEKTPHEHGSIQEDPSFSTPLLRFALLTGFWVLVCAAFTVQVSALGFAPWSVAAGHALLDWGPWIVFSPLVLHLARRYPIGPGVWRRALPLHLAASLALVTLMEGGMSALSLRRDLLYPHREYTRGPAGGASQTAGPQSGAPKSGQGGERERMPPPPRPASGGERERRGGPPGAQLSPPRFFWFRVFDRARIAIPVYWMLVAAAHALAQQRRSLERERRAMRAETLLAEARLQALQAQLKPHFLFNTLNTIAELVYENPEAAEDTIVSLGNLLRDVLSAQQRREIPLSDEIAFIERYCAIQRARFPDRLRLRCEIEPRAASALIPTLLLQPLVENAILHGLAPEQAGGEVIVRARLDGARLRIEVSDTGNSVGRGEGSDTKLSAGSAAGLCNTPPVQGAAGSGAEDSVPAKPVFKEGVGLTNTRGRLAALYGANHAFEIARAAEGGVAIRIAIPFRSSTP